MAIAVGLTPSAHAQEAAVAPANPHALASDVRPVPPQEPAPVGIGARFGYGYAYADGVPDSWLLRLDYETFLFITPRDQVGGLFGFLTGFDYWHAKDGMPDNWGFGLPGAFVVGVRAVAVRGLVGFGVNAFTIDQVADDTGVGWMAPLAVANLGLDIHGITAMFDARVSRRWQFGADDHTQWMLSVMIGATLEPRYNRRFFEPEPRK